MLLVLQFGLALSSVRSAGPGLGGDEPAYVAKATSLQEHRSFPRLPAAEWGRPFSAEFWGNSDWRPIGYPVVLAVVTEGQAELSNSRSTVTCLQFAGVAVALLLLYGSAVRGFALGGYACLALGLGLGLQPWAFAHVTLLGPESLTMVLTWFGLLALSWAPSGVRARAWVASIVGSGSLAAAGLLRPESLALAPAIIGLGLWAGRYGRQLTCRLAVVASLAFFSVLTVQVAYRWNLTGRLEIFGPVRFFNSGFFRWLHTWVNTEKAAYDEIAYRISSATVTIDELPPRAFRDPSERAEIARALDLVRRRGYSREVDRIFDDVAGKRVREGWVSALLIPRLSRTAQLWLNLETNTQYLGALSRLPRGLSRFLVAAATLGRGLVLMLFLATVALGWRRSPLPRAMSLTEILTLLSAAYVLLRTLLVGPVLGWMVARYMQPAWLTMLWCAVAGTVWSYRSLALRAPRRSVEAAGRDAS